MRKVKSNEMKKKKKLHDKVGLAYMVTHLLL